MTRDRDHIKAGLFMLSGIVLTLVIVFVFSDFGRLFEAKQTLRVHYALSDGLHGLKAGAAVTLGDVPIGEVSSINDRLDEAGRVTGSVVELTIPERYAIFQNAVIELVVPPLGSGTRLNIRSVGNTVAHDPASEPINGAMAGSALTENLVTDMGIEDQQRQQIKNIIANVEAISVTLREDVPQITGPAKQALADLQTVIADVREHRGEWIARIDNIIKSADTSMTRVDKLLEDKDPDIRRIVENLRDVTATVKDDILGRVSEALTKAHDALDDVKAATGQLKGFAISQRPVLERTVANLQLTAAQLKLTAIEVRRSPWRLLYKPTDEELESDNLYDAARSFALAAGTLDAAALSLQAVVQHQPQDTEQINAMISYLGDLFERFEQAEQAFWSALGEHQPAP